MKKKFLDTKKIIYEARFSETRNSYPQTFFEDDDFFVGWDIPKKPSLTIILNLAHPGVVFKGELIKN